jgi:hypothetical protein
MGRSSVYIETTVPSSCVTTRQDAASVYHREVSLRWWSDQLDKYEVFVSEAVLLELASGSWEGQSGALDLVRPLQRLVIDDEVMAVADRYVREKLVPQDLAGDALHLAVACAHEMSFLLTWNIRHLANPNKRDHLIVINRRLGLLTPQIVTPDVLWLEDAL